MSESGLVVRGELQVGNPYNSDFYEVPTDPKGEISTQQFHDMKKIFKYVKISAPLEAFYNENGATYSVGNASFHFLLYTYLKINLPGLSVKREFRNKVRIAWCKNIGHVISGNGQLKINENYVMSFDRVWMDHKSMYFLKPKEGGRVSYDTSVGNIPMLQEFSSVLPPFKLAPAQPFYYAKDLSMAFPLIHLKDGEKLNHSYIHQLSLANLIRIRLYDEQTDTWSDVKSPENIATLGAKFIDGWRTKIENPVLWGAFNFKNEIEVKWHKCRSKVYFIEDVIVIDQENQSSLGSCATMPINSKYPAVAVFWSAENHEAMEMNNHCNYTTNASDHEKGWSPISKTDISSGGAPRYKGYDDVMSEVEAREHFPSCPCELGYYAMSYANEPDSIDAETGLVTADRVTVLKVHLGDTDPMKKLKTDNSEGNEAQKEINFKDYIEGPKKTDKKDGGDYVVRVRVLVTKKLEFIGEGNNITFKVDDLDSKPSTKKASD